MTESAAERSGIFPGYRIADIDANYNDIQNTEETLKNIVAQTPNSSYFSVGEYQARNLQLGQIVGILVILLCISTGGFGIATTIITFYTRLVTRKMEFGLFEVFGMQKIDIIKSLLLENLIYLLMSLILGLSLVVTLNIQQGWRLSYLLNYVDKISIVSVTALLLGQLGIIIPIRTLLNQSIKDRIEYSE
jgi:ABC-type antimicrobial peptide transport system permease subunit